MSYGILALDALSLLVAPAGATARRVDCYMKWVIMMVSVGWTVIAVSQGDQDGVLLVNYITI